MKTKMKLELSVAEWADNEGWISETVLENREIRENEEITPDNCFDYSDFVPNPNLKYIAIMYEVEIDEFGNEERNELWRAEKWGDEEETEEVNEVIITDYSDYDSELCNNGGKYSYSTHYTKLKKNRWEVGYTSSAEFDMCYSCGRWDCRDDYCECQIVDDMAVKKEIANKKKNEMFAIETNCKHLDLDFVRRAASRNKRIREIKQRIEENESFAVYGIRVDDESKTRCFKINISAEEDVEENINSALEKAEKYSDHILLVAGDNCIYGVNPYDPMEISIIGNITMIDII